MYYEVNVNKFVLTSRSPLRWTILHPPSEISSSEVFSRVTNCPRLTSCSATFNGPRFWYTHWISSWPSVDDSIAWDKRFLLRELEVKIDDGERDEMPDEWASDMFKRVSSCSNSVLHWVEHLRYTIYTMMRSNYWYYSRICFWLWCHSYLNLGCPKSR